MGSSSSEIHHSKLCVVFASRLDAVVLSVSLEPPICVALATRDCEETWAGTTEAVCTDVLLSSVPPCPEMGLQGGVSKGPPRPGRFQARHPLPARPMLQPERLVKASEPPAPTAERPD